MNYLNEESLSGLRKRHWGGWEDAEALLKSLENKGLKLGILDPFLPTNWEKN